MPHNQKTGEVAFCLTKVCGLLRKMSGMLLHCLAGRLSQEPGDGPGHPEVGVVEVVAGVPFEDCVGTTGTHGFNNAGGAGPDLPHEGVTGAAFFVSEREVGPFEGCPGSIVPDVFRESWIP